MNKNFEEERQFVLNMAKQGIDININLNSKQKKYIKNNHVNFCYEKHIKKAFYVVFK